MKIGFDCNALLGEVAGVGQYSYNLLKALLKADRVNSYTPYVLYSLTHYLLHPGLKVNLPGEARLRVLYKHIPVPYQLLSYLRVPGMPQSLREYMLGGLAVDVVHSNSFCAPRFRDKRKRLVVTVYDLSVLTHPECHKKANIRHCTRGIEDAVKYADAIIAISDYTKRDLIRYMNAPEELVTVTQLAAGPEFKEVGDEGVLKGVREKYGLPEKYILFVGSLEPRKNLRTLLKAYAGLPDRFKRGFSLVIAGGKGWMNSDIPGLQKKLGIEGRVHFPGFIADDDICAVYSQAEVFVYPSLYEGFGLPILEAMACGTPVITSNASSMPEVAGDAALLVTPTEADELAGAIERVLDDEVLRGRMREQGLKRAGEFSWERCARETIEIYRKVVESGGR